VSSLFWRLEHQIVERYAFTKGLDISKLVSEKTFIRTHRKMLIYC